VRADRDAARGVGARVVVIVEHEQVRAGHARHRLDLLDRVLVGAVLLVARGQLQQVLAANLGARRRRDRLEPAAELVVEVAPAHLVGDEREQREQRDGRHDERDEQLDEDRRAEPHAPSLLRLAAAHSTHRRGR
jgi:hypothetical protein